jgi:hypothetical protein
MRSKRGLVLGATETGKLLGLKASVRTTHMHVLGASGRGKSYFLEYLIRQDIRNGDGVCVIDPHGTLYHNILAWCASQPSVISWDHLVLLDASAPGWAFGFNPLNFAGADISYCVDSMVHACAQVWGGEDTATTPLLKRALRGIFHVLAEHKLTLLEAIYLISERDELRPVREKLTTTIADPIIREQWSRWNEMPVSEFRKDFASSTNRLMEFFAAPIIRLILGQTQPVLDFRKAMDDSAVILVNLASSGRLSDFNARTLGTLLTNDLFLKAQARPEGSRPFYLYIDECGRYLNESIQRILDESRKRGLHLILANQHLSQLRAAGDTVYSAVITDAQTKVIFGGLSTQDAEIMVKEVFLDLDLEEPKPSLMRNVAVGQELVLLGGGSRGISRMEGTSDTELFGEAEFFGELRGENTSTQFFDGIELERGAWGVSVGTSEGHTDSRSVATSTMKSETLSEISSWTQAFKTIYEKLSSGNFSLEEQRYKTVAWLKKQPRQMALLVQPDFSLTPFRVANVRQSDLTDARHARLISQRFEALPFVQKEKDMFRQFERRTRELHARAGLPDTDVNLTKEIDFLDND